MQLTVILAKQISQLEDHDDDVALLPQIYSLIEEERRLHTFDNDIYVVVQSSAKICIKINGK